MLISPGNRPTQGNFGPNQISAPTAAIANPASTSIFPISLIVEKLPETVTVTQGVRPGLSQRFGLIRWNNSSHRNVSASAICFESRNSSGVRPQ